MAAGRETPNFVRGSNLLEEAFVFAESAHTARAAEGGTEIEHPVAVARLLADEGFDEDVVAAALLHDVVEHTDRAQSEILDRFRERVAGLVEVMTEDAAIDDYEERKAEHRRRVLDAGPTPASIYLADKLARVRSYAEAGEPVAAARLEHYRRTLAMFSASSSPLPFTERIADEIESLRPDPGLEP